jgi:V8-like Glu-specific endopeptidase
MQLTVDIARGALTGQRLTFPNQTVISIGRDPGSDVVLDAHQDILASTRHAEVRLGVDGSITYLDLGSSNGSFVNGAPITTCTLFHGSEVELGAGGPLLRFYLEDASAQGAVVPTPGPAAAVQPSPTAAAPVAAAPIAAPAAEPEHKVGARTVALIVEDAISKERTSSSREAKPRSTEFFRTIVDKEVRSKNKGLFAVIVLLGVLLVGGLSAGAWMFWGQRKKMKKQKDELTHKLDTENKAHQKALAASKAQTKAQMEKLQAVADKRQKEHEAALTKLRAENEKIKAMAKDKGPQVSKMNRANLYLLAYGKLGVPRYATCTAFAVSKRVLATNAHCVVALRKGATRGSFFYAVQNENPSFKAKVISTVKHAGYYRTIFRLTPDVGLVQVDKDLPSLVQIASDEELRQVQRGSLMFSFGFPGRLADPRKPIATLVHGRIGRMTRFNASMGTFAQSQLLQHSALSMGGASGSPLFNDAGKVIGIHAGSYTSRSSSTVFDPSSRTPKRIMMARRLGYKFGIRIDALSSTLAKPRWEKLEVKGMFSAVKAIPPDLMKVSCTTFARKLSTCSKGKVTRSVSRRRCEISKKLPTHSSVYYLRFAKCIIEVRGCSATKLSKCITKAKPAK